MCTFIDFKVNRFILLPRVMGLDVRSLVVLPVDGDPFQPSQDFIAMIDFALHNGMCDKRAVIGTLKFESVNYR